MRKEVNLYGKKTNRMNRTDWRGSPSRHVLTWSNPKWHNPAGDQIWRQSHRDVEKAADSKHSKGVSHEPLTSQMLDVAGRPSVISSPALLLDLLDFSPSKTGEFLGKVLALTAGDFSRERSFQARSQQVHPPSSGIAVKVSLRLWDQPYRDRAFPRCVYPLGFRVFSLGSLW